MAENNSYSEQAQRLARELGKKAARNLRDFGYTVTLDPQTGRYSYERPRPDVSDVFVHLQEGKRAQAPIDERQDTMYKSTVISKGRPTRTERRYQVRHRARSTQPKFASVSYYRFKWSTYLPVAFWLVVGHAVVLVDIKEER